MQESAGLKTGPGYHVSGISDVHIPTAIDLFAGCGGMSLGLRNAGFKIIYANEINKSAAATYKRNFPDVNLEVRDIRYVPAAGLFGRLGRPEVDVISAGTPCQGFSVAGRRTSIDSRNNLYKEVLRFTKVFRPKFVVLENVVGMLARRNRGTARSIKKGFRRVGYYPRQKVLSASRFGVPQKRRRVFVIASLKPISGAELFPEGKGRTIGVSAALADLAFLGSGQTACEYRVSPRSAYQVEMRKGVDVLYNHESTDHSKKIQRRFRSIPPGTRRPHWGATRKLTHFKLHPRRLANTITSIPEDSIHYRLARGLTVREMGRLQSFPDWFEFLGPRTTGGERRRWECPQYTQVANAVPPMMATAVFAKLCSAIPEYFPESTGGGAPLQRSVVAPLQQTG